MTHDPKTVLFARRACEIQEFVWHQVHGDLPNSQRIRLFAGFLSVVLEHHDSILLLLHTETNYGSAFALVRPLIETACRAHWMYISASDQQIEKILRGESITYPEAKDMFDKLAARYQTDLFFTAIHESWKTLCGYTHTGKEQLAWRFDQTGTITPSYSADAINEVLSASTAHVVLLAIVFCHATERSDAGRAIEKRYVELHA